MVQSYSKMVIDIICGYLIVFGEMLGFRDLGKHLNPLFFILSIPHYSNEFNNDSQIIFKDGILENLKWKPCAAHI